MSERSSWLPSLNALRAFEATARHSSFRKAAEELRVTSPAVQQLVRGLEEALGRPLVLRHGRAIEVTEAGTAGIGQLRDGFRQIADGVARIRSHAAARHLRVSVEPSFASGWLIGRLASFHACHPDIDILLDTSERLADLLAGEADVAIRYGRSPENWLVWRELFADETIAVGSPDVAGRIREIGDLAEETLIHFQRPTTMQPGWDRWLAALGAEPVRAARNLRFTDYTMMLHAAIASQGVALVSRPIVQQAIEAGMLSTLFGKGVRLGFAYHLVVAPDIVDRPDVCTFMWWIESEARKSTAVVAAEL